MLGRLPITVLLLFSLILPCAMSMGLGFGGIDVSGQFVPAVTEDEEAKSADEYEFGKSRHGEQHALPVDVASCRCVWHQLTIEAPDLLATLPGKTVSSRGPPSS